MSVLVLKNQFGEESINSIETGTTAALLTAQAAHTVIANNTAGSAVPTAVPNQTLVNVLPAKTGVAAISAESASTAATIALSTSNTYTDDAVNTAVNAALASVNDALNAAITQLNAVLAALKVVS